MLKVKVASITDGEFSSELSRTYQNMIDVLNITESSIKKFLIDIHPKLSCKCIHNVPDDTYNDEDLIEPSCFVSVSDENDEVSIND
ncbi:hypothetical protein C9J03_16060 [Photobacterium gaetbulicola]|uniref:Uncharacterized protein n=1 Tax=Photobacterium gaetbulicola Gung47 TaxID=658445 RepID=A0A0C5WD38_9GAMM|nr:hypothetical protein H744_2c2980 [Photobacterium gaetbulicola Gung47]PSU06466.1 hypothetical protein C9J03_16060 [Photobacterium gaetbulicola]